MNLYILYVHDILSRWYLILLFFQNTEIKLSWMHSLYRGNRPQITIQRRASCHIPLVRPWCPRSTTAPTTTCTWIQTWTHLSRPTSLNSRAWAWTRRCNHWTWATHHPSPNPTVNFPTVQPSLKCCQSNSPHPHSSRRIRSILGSNPNNTTEIWLGPINRL